MIFDVISFLAGLTAGGLVGGLASALFYLERRSDLEDRVVKLSQRRGTIDPTIHSSNGPKDADLANMKEIRSELWEVRNEMRRMFLKAAS